MKHETPNSEYVVRAANQGEYAVPEFQRGFVWTAAQVREFADSLSRGYPVGSILTWKSDIAIQRGDSNQPHQKSWLIDGQQRITALCTLFGKRPEWWDNNHSGTWNDHLNSFDIRLDIGIEELTFATRKSPESRYVPVRDILASEDLYALAEELMSGGRSYAKSIGSLANHLQKVASIKGAILPTVEIDDAIELT